jgi:glucose/arabinose dehydrogenase
MSDVTVGPDGLLYVLDIRDNEILRVEPRRQ